VQAAGHVPAHAGDDRVQRRVEGSRAQHLRLVLHREEPPIAVPRLDQAVRLEEDRLVRVDLHRRVVAAVDERHRAVVVELREHRGDEVLLPADGVDHLVQGHRDRGEIGDGQRRLAERPDDGCRELDGVQPLSRTSPTMIRTPNGVADTS
jgi:hypothetical protein